MRRRTVRIGWACLILIVGSGQVFAAEVSLSSSAGTVSQGGSLNFTATVTPSTFVQKVTFSFAGEGGTQEVTSPPYVVDHTFNTASDGVGVTATVDYSNGDPRGTASTSVDVVGLTITGPSSPTRGVSASSYTVQTNPTGKTVSSFSWSYATSGVTNTYADGNADTNDSSTWAGRMVASGTLSCSAMVSGVTVSASLNVSVQPRPWVTPITCAQDNESDWGDAPGPNTVLSEHRDRDSNNKNWYFVPRTDGTHFTPARSLGLVSSGPCAGLWYVSSTTLKCQRETVISQYVKAGGPELGGSTFYAESDPCMDPGAGEFVLALIAHEYRGPCSQRCDDGHHGKAEVGILDQGWDGRVAIEALVSLTGTGLSEAVNAAIVAVESALAAYANGDNAENDLTGRGPNWGAFGYFGSGATSRWDGGAWSGCIYGPESF